VCGTACSSTNGTPSCSAGACSIACTAGYANCDNQASTGCEININTDLNNCGSCGHVCTTSCVNGVCATPCTGICSNPINFTIDGGGKCTYGTNPQGSCASPQLGTGVACYQTNSVLSGGNCASFVSPRTLSLNGTVNGCGGWTIPARLNGGYCISTTAGDNSYAQFTVW
jgi:hypothetical protein